MKHVIIYIIKIYQSTLGLYMRGSCRFSPTCSEYMKQSILKYGVFRGAWFGVVRLAKCHPYSKHYGVEEV